MSAPVTHHSALSLGTGMALVNQNNYIDAINYLVYTTTFSLMTLLSNDLITIAQKMNTQLQTDSANQQAFTDEWAGDPNNNGYPTNLHDWLVKYGPSVGITDTGPAGEMALTFLWIDPNSKHSKIADYLTQFHEVYNTDQLHYQNLTSQAQKPVDQWSQTISDENKTTGSDYKLCSALLSIFKNLNSKTQNQQ